MNLADIVRFWYDDKRAEAARAAAVEKGIYPTGGKKGTVPICAKHPPGRSGKWGLSPFSPAKGSDMKRHDYFPTSRTATKPDLSLVTSCSGLLEGDRSMFSANGLSVIQRFRPKNGPVPCRPHAFTLVEMLVVITIIGILAGLITAAAVQARIAAKNAVIAVELSQLEAACMAYKEKFGEYPPDFTDSAAVTRHIAKAFPRYPDPSDWTTEIPNATGLNINELTPLTALTFWLGGMRDANGVPVGFSANPRDPFNATSTSRIKPFFDFDPNRLSGYRYWPQGAVGNRTSGAIAYFRAENGSYLTANTWMNDNDPAHVRPAIDTRLSDISAGNVSWINPESIQIFSSGLDVAYGELTDKIYGLQFPTGGNYSEATYDDVTNFSGGTLESAMD